MSVFKIPYDTYYCTSQVFHSLQATDGPPIDVTNFFTFGWVASPTEAQPKQMTMEWTLNPNSTYNPWFL